MDKTLLLATALALLGCSSDDPTVEEETVPWGPITVPAPPAMGSLPGGPCRVLVTAATKEHADSPAVDSPHQVSIRPVNVDGSKALFEVAGHPNVLTTPTELYQALEARRRQADASGRPPLVVHARADLLWRHLAAAVAAAQAAGWTNVQCVPGLQFRVEPFADDQAVRRWNPEGRLVLAARSDDVPNASSFVRRQAGEYWIGDHVGRQMGTAEARLIQSRLSKANAAGREEITVEVRADGELGVASVLMLVAPLHRLPVIPQQSMAPGPRPATPPATPTDPAPRSNFFGRGGNAHHIVYVVDRAGSMVESFDIVRREMLISISRLRPTQSFHVILFDKARPKEPSARRLVPATPRYKEEAGAFLDDIMPIGATNPTPALERAFEVLAKADAKKKGKLIYLLTDGDFPDNQATLAAIRKANAKVGAQINAYLLDYQGKQATETMQAIAKDSGGTFQHVRSDQ